jgi:phosphohistidine phosphatase SixA
VTIRVYLLRHGPAGLRSAWRGSDAERPLIKDGVRTVKQIGRALAAQGLEPDLILTSPYARSEQTAAIVAKALDRSDVMLIEKTLSPGFAIADFTALLESHADAGAIMLVGHEPDLSTLSALLCGARLALQKGGLIELELDRRHPNKAVLVRLEQPRHLIHEPLSTQVAADARPSQKAGRS